MHPWSSGGNVADDLLDPCADDQLGEN
jgi:hypothetical protein